MIKNIIFDLGGVIASLDRDRAIDRFRQLGLPDADQVIGLYGHKGIMMGIEDGSLTKAQFYDAFRQQAGKDIPDEDICHAWMGIITDVPVEKLEYITQLRKQYPVYLLSNTNPVIMDYWAFTSRFSAAGKPIRDYFDKMYLSYEMKLVKPDPAIFHAMIQDTSIRPEESVFIDDSKPNVTTAESLGFHTLQPINNEDWRDELSALLEK